MTGESTKKPSACLFGAVLAVLLMPAAVAQADDRDSDFTNYLAAKGIHLGAASYTGDLARTMCRDLDAGYTQADEIKQLSEHKLSQAQAEIFVGAATAEYCPEHHEPSRPSG